MSWAGSMTAMNVSLRRISFRFASFAAQVKIKLMIEWWMFAHGWQQIILMNCRHFKSVSRMFEFYFYRNSFRNSFIDMKFAYLVFTVQHDINNVTFLVASPHDASLFSFIFIYRNIHCAVRFFSFRSLLSLKSPHPKANLSTSEILLFFHLLHNNLEENTKIRKKDQQQELQIYSTAQFDVLMKTSEHREEEKGKKTRKQAKHKRLFLHSSSGWNFVHFVVVFAPNLPWEWCVWVNVNEADCFMMMNGSSGTVSIVTQFSIMPIRLCKCRRQQTPINDYYRMNLGKILFHDSFFLIIQHPTPLHSFFNPRKKKSWKLLKWKTTTRF